MQRLSLVLSGMGCGGCVNNVRKVLDRVPGVVIHDVAIGSAELRYDPALVSETAITKALGAAGYTARASGRAAEDANVSEKGGHCGIAS